MIKEWERIVAWSAGRGNQSFFIRISAGRRRAYARLSAQSFCSLKAGCRICTTYSLNNLAVTFLTPRAVTFAAVARPSTEQGAAIAIYLSEKALNKKVLTTALLASSFVGTAAHAQGSVTLYGIVDAGISYANHSKNAAGSSSKLFKYD